MRRASPETELPAENQARHGQSDPVVPAVMLVAKISAVR